MQDSLKWIETIKFGENKTIGLTFKILLRKWRLEN